MALWTIAILLLPVSLNELDRLAGKLIKLHKAYRRKKRGC
jgi:hypothetical protein